MGFIYPFLITFSRTIGDKRVVAIAYAPNCTLSTYQLKNGVFQLQEPEICSQLLT